jgi:hypothetical protein
MSTIDNGSQDMIDQTGLKSIQNHMLIQIPIDKFSIALLNLLLLLLLNNKLKKLLLTQLLQNHKLMLLLQLSIKKRTSFKLEWIKLEVKLKNLETQEDGDLFGQLILLLKLQKTLIKLKLLLLITLLTPQEFKVKLKLKTFLILPHLMLMPLMVLLKLN